MALLGVPAAMAALAETTTGRVFTLLVTLLGVFALRAALQRKGLGRAVFHGIAGVAFAVTVVGVLVAGGSGAPLERPTNDAAETSGRTVDGSSQVGQATPITAPSDDTAPAVSTLTGPDAPTGTLATASTTEFFSDTPLVVGLANVFSSFVSLNLSTRHSTCPVYLETGETAVIRAGDEHDSNGESVWLKLTVLSIEAESIHVRAERTLGAMPPATEQCR